MKANRFFTTGKERIGKPFHDNRLFCKAQSTETGFLGNSELWTRQVGFALNERNDVYRDTEAFLLTLTTTSKIIND